MAAICAQWKSCKGDDDGEKNSKIIYKDPGQPVEARVEDLLSRMTVAEKIGQMTQIERAVASPDVIEKFGIGSILNGGGSAPALHHRHLLVCGLIWLIASRMQL